MNKDKNLKIGVIGNEKMAIRCLQQMQSFAEIEIPFVIYDQGRDNPGNSVKDYCIRTNLPSFGLTKLNSPEITEMIRQAAPDLILSISNYWIIKKEILSIPAKGVINFHNGPPSDYRGIYVPSWVIMNGETEHGVMWHYAEENVDAGDVIGYRMFELDPEETAASLMVKCITTGIDLFRELLPGIVGNTLQRMKQNANASYYSKKDHPENNGYLDFSWTFEKLDRMVRGLNYIPFANPFCHAKINSRHGEVIVNKLSKTEIPVGGTPHGTVLRISESEFRVVCKDAVLNLESCMDDEWTEYSNPEIAKILGISEGYVFQSNNHINE